MSKVAFAGTPDFAVTILEGLVASGQEIILVVTQPDRPTGRGQGTQPSPVGRYAAAHDLALAKPDRISQVADRLATAEVLVVAAYGQILPPEVLRAPQHGALNVHASLLPAYRGASPIQQVLLDGQAETGVTIMLMDEGLDTGPILRQRTVPVAPDDTAETLSVRLAETGSDLLQQTLPDFLAGKLKPVPQGKSPTPLTRLVSKEDGRLDWSLPAVALARRVRALNPWPGGWTRLAAEPLKIIQATAVPDKLPPGSWQGHEQGLLVGTGEGTLLVTRLQPAGKKEMAAKDWLRGRTDTSGRFD